MLTKNTNQESDYSIETHYSYYFIIYVGFIYIFLLFITRQSLSYASRPDTRANRILSTYTIVQHAICRLVSFYTHGLYLQYSITRHILPIVHVLVILCFLIFYLSIFKLSSLRRPQIGDTTSSRCLRIIPALVETF